jgi:hypothetical protein
MEAENGARGRPGVESDGTGRQPTEGGGGRREGQAGPFLRPGFRARVRVPVGFCAGRNRVLTFG